MCSPLVSWARLPLPFQPPGASLSWASIQPTGSFWKSWMPVPCGQRRSSPVGPSPDNPSQPTWTLALGTTFVRRPALRPQEQQGSQRPEGDPGVFSSS